MNKIEDLFEKGPIVVFRWKNDEDWSVEFVTDNVLEITGYSEGEWLAGAVLYGDIIHPQDSERVRREVAENNNAGVKRFSHSPYRIVSKDGSVKWVSDYTYYIRNEEGDITGSMGYISDVTEQRQKEKVFEELQKLTAIFDGIDNPIHVITTDFKIVKANRRLLDLVNLTEDQMIGRRCYEMIYNLSEPCKICAPGIVMKTGEKAETEKNVVRPDGSPLYLRSNSYPIFDDSGKIVQLIEIMEDLTEKKKAEEKLQKILNEQNLLLNALPAMVFWVDRDGNFIRVNKRFGDVFGILPGEIVGRSIFDVYPDHLARRFYADNQEVIESGIPKTNIEVQMETPGELIWLRTDKLPFEEDGIVKGVIGLSVDVTEQKKAHKHILEEREKFLATIHSMGEGVITADISGRVDLMNAVAENLTGWVHAEAVGKPLSDVFEIINEQDRKRLDNPAEKALRERVVVDIANHSVLISRDGTEYDIAGSAAPIGGAKGVVLIFRNITEILKTEKDLFKARKLESVGLLAGGIAHDFNNILAGLFGNLELAKTEIPLDHRAFSYIDNAGRSLERSMHLTNQLLTFAKGGEPVIEDMDVMDVVQDNVLFNLSGSNVRADIKPGKDLWLVKADKGQLGQVFTNLIINARQAMPTGGVIHIEGENVEEGGGHFVRITVRDEGIGVPEKHIDKIFDPYFTTKQTGSGLGLATVHSIIQRHNGRVSVESNPGKGTAFQILLPAEETSRKVTGPHPVAATSSPFNPGRVLIMDDDAMVRDVLGEMLGTLGYETDFAYDGEEAIEKYQNEMKEKPFSLVVMDLTIPGGIGGKEAAQKLLAIDPAAKLIVTSGYSDDPVIAHFDEYGFCGRFTKPFTIQDLKRGLEKIG